MKFSRRLLMFIGLAAGMAMNAHALDFQVLGGLNRYQAGSENSNYNAHNKWGYAYGAQLGMRVAPFFSTELGIFQIQKRQNFTGTNTDYTESRTSLYVPVMLRFKPIPLASVAGGVYYENNQTKTNRSGTINGATIDDSIARSLKRNDLGAVLSARLELPIFFYVRLIIDARMNYGFAKVDPSRNERNKEFLLFAGPAIVF